MMLKNLERLSKIIYKSWGVMEGSATIKFCSPSVIGKVLRVKHYVGLSCWGYSNGGH